MEEAGTKFPQNPSAPKSSKLENPDLSTQIWDFPRPVRASFGPPLAPFETVSLRFLMPICLSDRPSSPL